MSKNYAWLAFLGIAVASGCGDDCQTNKCEAETPADAGAGEGGVPVCVETPEEVTLQPENYLGPHPGATTPIKGKLSRVNEAVYQSFDARDFTCMYMVVTDEGNVIIDTGDFGAAVDHRRLLKEVDDGPIKYIILTHAHLDHMGGIQFFKERGTEVIAQSEHVEFVDYQKRLQGFLGHRGSRQFPFFYASTVKPWYAPDADVHNHSGDVLADTLFDDFHEFKLGGLTFQLVHTPGETYDHLTVWIPEYKIAFVGDNYYPAFPNIYTLRGTKPRWALDYVASLDRVISWKPEIVATMGGAPLYGDDVERELTKYRDAILHVHDRTVQGMNAGKDVFTLMREIALPPELQIGQGYGNLPWSIRGIYEGYAGWFDGNVANMYPTPARAVYPEVVAMAGGAAKVAGRAQELKQEGKLQEALRMADMALSAEPGNLDAQQARLDALRELRAATINLNEQGWLDSAINDTEAEIGIGDGSR